MQAVQAATACEDLYMQVQHKPQTDRASIFLSMTTFSLTRERYCDYLGVALAPPRFLADVVYGQLMCMFLAFIVILWLLMLFLERKSALLFATVGQTGWKLICMPQNASMVRKLTPKCNELTS